MKTACFTILLLITATLGYAAPLVYEGFSVPPYSGDIVGESGGSGWTSSWINPGSPNAAAFDSEPVGLTYTDIQTTPGGVTVSMNVGASGGIDRSFSTSGFSNIVYLGYLINLSGSSAFDYFYVRLESQLGHALLGHIGGSQWRASLQDAGDNFVNGVSGSGNVVDNVTTHLILKLEFNQNGPNERITLFINPPSGSEPTVPAEQTRNDINIGTSLTGQTQMGIANGLDAMADEVRIGTSYNDMFGVVPEPSTYALITLAGVFLLLRYACRRSNRDL